MYVYIDTPASPPVSRRVFYVSAAKPIDVRRVRLERRPQPSCLEPYIYIYLYRHICLLCFAQPFSSAIAFGVLDVIQFATILFKRTRVVCLMILIVLSFGSFVEVVF